MRNFVKSAALALAVVASPAALAAYTGDLSSFITAGATGIKADAGSIYTYTWVSSSAELTAFDPG
ncbi:MAG TPA: hypothetical protein VES73_13785, partial [Lamprocystis sp. (in: g-proteobacteria)]|nr:hypothetical protein [Lamprocystis sp. (in: g-proteobacteria)]